MKSMSMKRSAMLLALIAAVTLLLPWLAVTCLPADADMAACLLLFYAVNPLTAILAGALGQRWYWPVVHAVAFMLGSWLIFSPGEQVFLFYAGVYLMIGFAALGLRLLLAHR